MYWYWMETTNLAPLHCLDPSLPFRRLGRRYVRKRQFNNQRSQGWANNFWFGCWTEKEYNRKQVIRHLLSAEPNVNIFVFLTESIFFFNLMWKEVLLSSAQKERQQKVTWQSDQACAAVHASSTRRQCSLASAAPKWCICLYLPDLTRSALLGFTPARRSWHYLVNHCTGQAGGDSSSA